MLPNKCKCGWIPYVAYKTDLMLGHTIGFYVVCENCYRRGEMQFTRDEAIANWNCGIAFRTAMETEPRPKKIKIASKVAHYLDSLPSPFVDRPANMPEGTVGYCESTPIEIDDDIENEYYELVYEEN